MMKEIVLSGSWCRWWLVLLWIDVAGMLLVGGRKVGLRKSGGLTKTAGGLNISRRKKLASSVQIIPLGKKVAGLNNTERDGMKVEQRFVFSAPLLPLFCNSFSSQ